MSDHSPFPPELADARARAGKAIRDLGHALLGHEADVERIDTLTVDLVRWTDVLRTGNVRDRVIERPTGDWGPPPADGEEMWSFDERPISGRSSPLGVDLRVVRDGDEAVGYFTLDSAHEGAPRRSHGGMISAVFDDMFGFVLTLLGQPGFTGELTVRYEAGTPIHVPLECRVRLAEQDGRKLHMTGELTDAAGTGDAYATGRAVFIAIDAEAFRAATS